MTHCTKIKEIMKNNMEGRRGGEFLPDKNHNKFMQELDDYISSRVGAVVSPDFWRILTRKLTTEYANIRMLEDENSILIKKLLEPFIDALIKTEQEING